MNTQYIECSGLCNTCVCCYSLPHRSGAEELLGIRSWSSSTEVIPQVPQDPLILSHMAMFRIYLYQFVYPTYIDSSYIHVYIYTDFLFHPTTCFPVKSLLLAFCPTFANQPHFPRARRRFHTSHGYRLKAGKQCCNERCQCNGSRVVGLRLNRSLPQKIHQVNQPKGSQPTKGSLQEDVK